MCVQCGGSSVCVCVMCNVGGLYITGKPYKVATDTHITIEGIIQVLSQLFQECRCNV